MSAQLIFVNKNIAKEAHLNKIPFEEEKIMRKNKTEEVLKTISSFNIHHQFEFFKLLCYACVDSNKTFQIECLENVEEFIKLGYLIRNKNEKHREYYEFSTDFKVVLRNIFNALSDKFPKIQKFDNDGILIGEKRIISPEFLASDDPDYFKKLPSGWIYEKKVTTVSLDLSPVIQKIDNLINAQN